MRMEFVLCIRFALTKIQTAQFIVVAQFLTIPNPSSKTLEGKEENHCPHPRNQARVFPEPPNGRWFATTVRGLFRRFDYLTTTTVMSVVGVYRQSCPILEKHWRKTHTPPHTV